MTRDRLLDCRDAIIFSKDWNGLVMNNGTPIDILRHCLGQQIAEYLGFSTRKIAKTKDGTLITAFTYYAIKTMIIAELSDMFIS